MNEIHISRKNDFVPLKENISNTDFVPLKETISNTAGHVILAERSLFSETSFFLETEDLILRKARQEDWKAIYENVWCHAETARYMLWNVTTSEEDAIRRMERTIAFQQQKKYALFVYEKGTGIPIGFAGMDEVEPGVFEEMGIALGPDYTGKGFGKQILNALIDEAKSCGARRFIASCRKQNLPSHKLQMACGFSFSHNEDRTDPRTGENYELEFNEVLL